MGVEEGEVSASRTRLRRGDPPTYFAHPERTTSEKLRQQVRLLMDSPVVDTLLQAFSGWVAVLNRQRQILALNHSFLHRLGLSDPTEALGLRLGEALECKHAEDPPAGCGTTRTCQTCGAAIATVACLEASEPADAECALTVLQGEVPSNHDFLVRAVPFRVEGTKFLLISMREITEEKQRMAAERAFLHDMANILGGLSGSLELAKGGPDGANTGLLKQAHESARLLTRELRIQRMLLSEEGPGFEPEPEETNVFEVLRWVEGFFSSHSASRGRLLVLDRPSSPGSFRTDVPTLQRILVNLVINALEAGGEGDPVRVRGDGSGHAAVFQVWNPRPIPEPVIPRVFQRYFSTKRGPGRGLGAYSAKLLCESVLKGSLTFHSSPAEGTTFRVELPIDLAREPAGESAPL